MAVISPQGLGAIKDAGDVSFYDLATNEPALHINYANNFTINLSSDFEVALAKGEERVVFPKPTTGEATIGVQLMSPDLFALIMGSKMLQGLTDYYKREVFEVTESDQVVTLKGTPKNGVSVYKVRKDLATHLGKLETATNSTNTVSLIGAVVGEIYAVYYIEQKEGRSFTVKATPEESRSYLLNCLVRIKSAEDGTDSFLELDLNKVTIQNSIDLEFNAETPSSFEIKLKLQTDANSVMLTGKEVPKI